MAEEKEPYIQYEIIQARPTDVIAHRIGFMTAAMVQEWEQLGWTIKFSYPNTVLVKDREGKLVQSP